MAVQIRRLTPPDVPAVVRLAGQAGWNQTDADVNRLLALEAHGAFAADAGGRVVGTTTTITYGSDLAWLGMVLVDPDFRRRGIASALVESALGYLRGRGVRAIKLDATPAGQPVYERLGFEPERVLERWSGTPSGTSAETILAGSWSEVPEVDRAAFGADRSRLLDAMIADSKPPLVVRRADGNMAGYALVRRGARVGYVGPVVAAEVRTARALLTTAAGRTGEAVYIDIDPAFPGAAETMRQLGFTRERELMRMRLGRAIGATGPLRVFAIAGPEVG